MGWSQTEQDPTLLNTALHQIYNKFAQVCGGAVMTATGVHFQGIKVTKGGGGSSKFYMVRVNIFQKAAAAINASCLLCEKSNES